MSWSAGPAACEVGEFCIEEIHETLLFSFWVAPGGVGLWALFMTGARVGSRLQGGAISYGDAIRFLGQATFGPTTDLAEHVQRIGYQAFLEEQFSAPRSDYPEPAPLGQPTARRIAPVRASEDNYTIPSPAYVWRVALVFNSPGTAR